MNRVPTVADLSSLPAHAIAIATIAHGGNANLRISCTLPGGETAMELDVVLGTSAGTADSVFTGQRLTLVRRTVPRGGWRWWWVCQATGLAASNLYLCRGAWASRAAHRLAYPSQRAVHPIRELYRYAWRSGVLERP